MIKTLEAQLGQFLLGCKCPVSRGTVVQEQESLGDIPRRFSSQNVLQFTSCMTQGNFECTGVKETSANRFCDLGPMSIHPQTQHPSTALKKGHCCTNNFATEVVDESVQDRKRGISTCVEDSDYLLDDIKECECFVK